MFSLTCAWTNGWVKNRDAGDLRRRRADYDVTLMWSQWTESWFVQVMACRLFRRHQAVIQIDADSMLIGLLGINTNNIQSVLVSVSVY